MKTLTVMSKYKTYKVSNVDWLDEIPVAWSEKKLKFLSNIDNSGEYGVDPELKALNYPVATTAQITSDGVFLVEKMPIRGFSSEVASRYLCKEGDILVVKSSGSISNVISGKVGIVSENTEPFVFSNFLLRIRSNPNKVVARYIYYLLTSNLTKERVKRMVTGSTYPNLQVPEYVSALMPLPPYNEQTRIVSFLDRKTIKIDQAIAIKEKQIFSLKERKQILLHNAVTSGIDPNVLVKESGVEWIGAIPENWVIKRAKYLFNEIDERSIDGKEELLSVSHMTGVTLRSEKNVSMFMSEDYTGSKTCQTNDLVFNIMWTWMGALGVSDHAGIVSSSYGIFRQKEAGIFNSKYLENLLKTTGYIEHYNKVSTGLHSSRLRFYAHMFLNMEIGFPDRKEQNEIVKYIDAQSSIIEKSIDLQQSQIYKLKEYKSTLINSAITGKIKVA